MFSVTSSGSAARSISRSAVAVTAAILGLFTAAGPSLAGPLQATAKFTGPSAANARFSAGVHPIGDVNGDGLADLSVLNAGRFEIVLGTRDAGGLQLPSKGGKGFVVDPAGEAVDSGRAAGDVDRDGYGDIAFAGGTRSFVLYGSASPSDASLGAGGARVTSITNAATYYSGPLMKVGDFNGDGYDDLVRKRSTDAVIVLGGPRVSAIDARTTGARLVVIGGIQTCSWKYGFFYSCTTDLQSPVPVGDVNRDGRGDLFQPDRGFITLGRAGNARLSGAGPDAAAIVVKGLSFASSQSISLAPGAFGDLTGDGVGDLVIRNGYPDNSSSLQVVPGRAITGGTIDPATTASIKIAPAQGESFYGVQPAGDHNGDGRQDLALTSYGKVRVLALTGTAPSTETADGPLVPVPMRDAAGILQSGYDGQALGAGDLDGDATPDLMVRVPYADDEGVVDRGALYLATRGPDRLPPALFPLGVTAPDEGSALKPAVFAATPSGSGTVIRLNLMERGDVQLTWRRGAGGTVLGSELRRGLPAGVTETPWDGRGYGVDGAAGEYVLEATLIDAAGNRSAAQVLPFTVRAGGLATKPRLLVSRRQVIPEGSVPPPERDGSAAMIEGPCGGGPTWIGDATGGPHDVPLQNPAEGDLCELTYATPAVTDGYGNPPLPDELEDYPWRTKVSVNGGAPVEITVGERAGARPSIPSFRLRAGDNTVEVVDTWDDHVFTNPPTDFTSALSWTYPKAAGTTPVNSAKTTAAGLQLTSATANQIGVAYACPTGLDPNRMVVEFDAELSGGNGAYGLTFAVFDQKPAALLNNPGVGLGWVGYQGTAWGLVTRKERYNPSENFVGIATGAPGKSGYPTWLQTSTPGWPASSVILAGRTSRVKIQNVGGWTRFFIDGSYRGGLQLSYAKTGCIGFTAATGPMYQQHLIKNLKVTRP